MSSKRYFLLGGAAVFGAMITALLGGTKPVRAQSISGAVPEVDSLAVRVVIVQAVSTRAAGSFSPVIIPIPGNG